MKFLARVWYALRASVWLCLARLSLEIAFVRDPSLRAEWRRLRDESDR